MQNSSNQDPQLVAKIRLLGFSKKNTINELTQALQENPNLIISLKILVACRQHKDYQLSLSQISKIAVTEQGIENLNAYKKYYPQLQQMGFNFEKLLDIVHFHAPYIIFPILIDTILELKPKGWSDTSIQKLFSIVQKIENLDLLKQHFFQFKHWHLSRTQILDFLNRYTAFELEQLVSNLSHLEKSGYSLNKLLDIIFTHGLEHLCSLKDFEETPIAKHYTRNELLTMINHVDGCQRLHALRYNYLDLKAMGYTSVKIKLLILQELHQSNSFTQKNMNQFDDYMIEVQENRRDWFRQEVYSLFASSEEINERCAMYLEDLTSKKIKKIS